MGSIPIPISDPIARPERDSFRDRRRQRDPLEGTITEPWIRWFDSRELTLDAATIRKTVVSLTGQAATIGATDISGGSLSTGLYQVSYYARITQAATTSSSLTVTLDWTDGGVSPSYSGAAITGNTTTTVQSGVILIHIDANAPVRYSTAYASVGATPMNYRLDVVLSEVSA